MNKRPPSQNNKVLAFFKFCATFVIAIVAEILCRVLADNVDILHITWRNLERLPYLRSDLAEKIPAVIVLAFFASYLIEKLASSRVQRIAALAAVIITTWVFG